MRDKKERLLELAKAAFPDLSEAEEKMLRAAAKGEDALYADLAEIKENKLPDPQSWGKDRTLRAAILRWLCTEGEARHLVDPTGLRVVGAKVDGQLDLGDVKVPFGLAFLFCALDSGLELSDARAPSLWLERCRTGPIRAERIRVGGVVHLIGGLSNGEVCLCGAKIAGNLACRDGTFTNFGGIALGADGAEIGGIVRLDQGFRAEGIVRFIGAKVNGDFSCDGGDFVCSEIETQPSKKEKVALALDGAQIGRDLHLDRGFRAIGTVRLIGASILGSICCRGGRFENAGNASLLAERAVIGGSVFLAEDFHSKGKVFLVGARIRGDLACTGGTFENQKDDVLLADRAEIGGSVFLNENFRATGEVRLVGTKIAGDLACQGGNFENTGGDALCLDGAEIRGSVFLAKKFHAKGEVRLVGAMIHGALACTGGTFENPGCDALSADSAEVGGTVFLDEGFRAMGEVRLLGAKIRGNLQSRHCTFENQGGEALCADGMDVGGMLFMDAGFRTIGALHLIHARARVIQDDPESWPEPGNLDLRGFTYEAIEKVPTDAKTRLKWLARQYPTKRRRGHYHPQPYEQLAAVLRRAGHVAESKKVLMAKEKHLRKFGDLGRLARVWNWFLWATLGYGYRVRRVLYCAAAVIGFGILFFWLGHGAGLLSPTFPSAAEAAAPCEKRLDETFCPWVYSLDTFLPIVNLHQEGRWLPNRGGSDVVATFCPDRYVGITWGDVLCAWFWFEIGAGWLLTTLALAGLTGLIRRD